MEEDMISIEKHDEEIIKLEDDYENLEQSFWVTVSFLLAVIAHLYYHDWFLTIGVLIGVFFLGWKFLAKRPFTKNFKKEMEDHNDR